jgi:hypothetical protein
MNEVFTVFTGVVEDRMDPQKLGRVRVRCFFIHPIDKSLVPTADLPWARVILKDIRLKEGDQVKGYFEDYGDYQMPVVNEKINGIPESAGDPNNGFTDPRTPTILESAPKFPKELAFTPGQKVDITEQDAAPREPARLNEPLTSRLVRNESLDDYLANLNKERLTSVSLGIQSFITSLLTGFLTQIENAVIGQINALIARIPGLSLATSLAKAAGFNKFALPTTYTQPTVAYNAKYPYNNAHVSESGHIQEVDDTPGAERIHTRHRSGTYDEMRPDGDRVLRTAGDQHNIVSANSTVVVQGVHSTLVEGSEQVIVKGARLVQIEGASQVVIMGDASVSVQGNMTTNVGGNYVLTAGGSVVINSVNKMALNAASDLTLTSETKLGLYSDFDVELMAVNKFKQTVLSSDWELKMLGGKLKFDMIVPGMTNQPINLNAVTNQALNPPFVPPVANFTKLTPSVVTDVQSSVEEQIEDAVDNAAAGQGLVIDITPDTTSGTISTDDGSGNYR